MTSEAGNVGAASPGAGQSEEILRAVAYSARAFAGASSWRDVVPDVLARLGAAAGASRAYVFENSLPDGGELLMTETFEWCAPGISPTVDIPDNTDFPYS